MCTASFLRGHICLALQAVNLSAALSLHMACLATPNLTESSIIWLEIWCKLKACRMTAGKADSYILIKALWFKVLGMHGTHLASQIATAVLAQTSSQQRSVDESLQPVASGSQMTTIYIRKSPQTPENKQPIIRDWGGGGLTDYWENYM